MDIKPIIEVRKESDGTYTVSISQIGFKESFKSAKEVLDYANEIKRQAETIIDYKPLYLRETPEHKVEIIRGDKVLRVSGPHGAIDYANDIREQLKKEIGL